jgi:hypothetical protein
VKNYDPTGLAAFKAALRPQEGRFMRNATWIMNKPKDYGPSVETLTTIHKKASDNVRIAAALIERNAKGQFVKHRSTKDEANDDE